MIGVPDFEKMVCGMNRDMPAHSLPCSLPREQAPLVAVHCDKSIVTHESILRVFKGSRITVLVALIRAQLRQIFVPAAHEIRRVVVVKVSDGLGRIVSTRIKFSA